MEGIENNINAALRHVENEIEKAMRWFMEKLRTDADKIIRDNKAIATAEMVKNLRYNVAKEIGKITGVLGVGGNAPHAIFKHEDCKPHFPPVEAIQKWVLQKGIVKNMETGKSTKMKAMYRGLFSGNKRARLAAADTLQTARDVAYLIARKIAKHGTKGLPFLKMALNQNKDYLIQRLAMIKI